MIIDQTHFVRLCVLICYIGVNTSSGYTLPAASSPSESSSLGRGGVSPAEGEELAFSNGNAHNNHAHNNATNTSAVSGQYESVMSLLGFIDGFRISEEELKALTTDNEELQTDKFANGEISLSRNAIYEELNDLLGNGLDSSPTAHLDPTLFHHRISCGSDTIPTPAVRIDSSENLKALRKWMKTAKVSAYLVTRRFAFSGNSLPGNQLKFISGFGGSNGFVIVTLTRAVLWTDGRYEVEADEILDCNWGLIVRDDISLAIAFVKGELDIGQTMAVNPALISSKSYAIYEDALAAVGLQFASVVRDPFTDIWTLDRPAMANNPIYVHEIEFTGETVASKIGRLQQKMAANNIDVQVVTHLAEVAWLYNLRGSDTRSSPLFYSFSLVFGQRTRLYVNHFDNMTTRDSVMNHLQLANANIRVFELHDFLTDLETAASQHLRISISDSTNQQVYEAAGASRVIEPSPVELMKSLKNEVQIRRYRQCQIRDSAAVVEFVSYLESQILDGKHWTEMSVARELKRVRRNHLIKHGLNISEIQPERGKVKSVVCQFYINWGKEENVGNNVPKNTYQYNRGTSFGTIAGVGSNGAIIHYTASNLTDTALTMTDTFLLDSGGQYLDGTTDVTRTFHYGTPTTAMIDAYTRVLVGVIRLATSVWPYGTTGRVLDTMARSAMWQYGMDYKHGTGHGIGYFTTVHEGPSKIADSKRSETAPLEYGTFLSDEPGYYLRGEFAVRLESIVLVVKADTKYHFGSKDYLGFEALTLIPFEPKLIDYTQLNQRERQWLNSYNKECIREISKYLKNKSGLDEDRLETALDWLEERTEYIPDQPNWEDVSDNINAQAMKTKEPYAASNVHLPSFVCMLTCILFIFSIKN